MSANVVRVMASQVWADQIAQLLHDGGVNVPVAALGASRRAARCQTGPATTNGYDAGSRSRPRYEGAYRAARTTPRKAEP